MGENMNKEDLIKEKIKDDMQGDLDNGSKDLFGINIKFETEHTTIKHELIRFKCDNCRFEISFHKGYTLSLNCPMCKMFYSNNTLTQIADLKNQITLRDMQQSIIKRELSINERVHLFREYLFDTEIFFKNKEGNYLEFDKTLKKFDELFKKEFFELIPPCKMPKTEFDK